MADYLPNAGRAYVEEEKLVGYLLSPVHPVGRDKARFFAAHGFHRGNARWLEQGLLQIARGGPVVEVTTSPFGVKYAVEGDLRRPGGGSIRLQTVWIVERKGDAPRLVTAFPA